MFTHKRMQFLILLSVALALVAFSVIATLLVTHHLESSGKRKHTKAALGVVEDRPRFELFAGHALCEQAIYQKMEGKILNLHMDPRNAKYHDYERTNTLVFTGSVVPVEQKFLSEQHSTVKMKMQCVTSADSNKLLSLIISPVDG